VKKYNEINDWVVGKWKCDHGTIRYPLTEQMDYNLIIKCGNCLTNTSLSNYEFAVAVALDIEDDEENYIMAVCPNCKYFTINNLDTDEPISLVLNSSVHNEIINKIFDEFLKKLFLEFNQAYSYNLNSAATLLARKILMHIAVSEGAKENENFVYYINYIAEQNLIGIK